MISLHDTQAGQLRPSLWRSRWAAIGAAVAVSLGAGGMFVAQAAPGPAESTIVSVTPERILDTRDPVNLGLAGPFVSPVSQKLKVTGSIPTATGTKIVVPDGATKVSATQLSIARSSIVSDIVPDPNGTTKVLTSVTIDTPVAGIVQLTGNTRIFASTHGSYTCLLSTGAGSLVDLGSTYRRLEVESTAGARFCATSGSIAVAPGVHVFNLAGNTPTGGDYDDTTLNALFVPGGAVALTVELTEADEKTEWVTPARLRGSATR